MAFFAMKDSFSTFLDEILLKKKKENFEMEWIQLKGMGWHEVQWKGPKHAEMILIEISKWVKELKQTDRRGITMQWNVF